MDRAQIENIGDEIVRGLGVRAAVRRIRQDGGSQSSLDDARGGGGAILARVKLLCEVRQSLDVLLKSRWKRWRRKRKEEKREFRNSRRRETDGAGEIKWDFV